MDAVALLKGKNHTLPPELVQKTLDDATLVNTGIDFSSEPSELALELSETLGDALDSQDDPRGVFVMPAKAQPKAQSYQAVIDEIGELGMWVEKVEAPDMAAMGVGGGAFGALVGELMQALDPSTMADMQAAMQGDAAAMARVQAKMTEALGGEEALAARSDELLRAAREGAAALGGQVDVDALMKQAQEAQDADDDKKG